VLNFARAKCSEAEGKDIDIDPCNSRRGGGGLKGYRKLLFSLVALIVALASLNIVIILSLIFVTFL
jgi:hypothetical protein